MCYVDWRLGVIEKLPGGIKCTSLWGEAIWNLNNSIDDFRTIPSAFSRDASRANKGEEREQKNDGSRSTDPASVPREIMRSLRAARWGRKTLARSVIYMQISAASIPHCFRKRRRIMAGAPPPQNVRGSYHDVLWPWNRLKTSWAAITKRENEYCSW